MRVNGQLELAEIRLRVAADVDLRITLLRTILIQSIVGSYQNEGIKRKKWDNDLNEWHRWKRNQYEN